MFASFVFYLFLFNFYTYDCKKVVKECVNRGQTPVDIKSCKILTIRNEWSRKMKRAELQPVMFFQKRMIIPILFVAREGIEAYGVDAFKYAVLNIGICFFELLYQHFDFPAF